jgi:hypothetical protein
VATRRGPDNTVRFSIGGKVSNVNWANVMWAQLTMSGTPSVADLEGWLTAFVAAYDAQFSAYITSNATYTQAQAQLFLPSNGLVTALIAVSDAGSGSVTNADNLAGCAVVSWSINAYWRGGKPRTYLPAILGSLMVSNDRLTTTAITNLTGDAGDFLTAMNALSSGAITDTTLGTVSFRSANADRVPPVFFAYTGAKVHPKIGTQRRRLGKWIP